MSLPALASLDELTARVGTIDDPARAQAALEDASSTIRAFTRRTWTDSTGNALALPSGSDAWQADVLVKVCCSVARRVLENPDGVQAESLGSYSVTNSNASADVYLTRGEQRDLESVIGKGGLWSQPTTRSLDDIPDVIDCVNADSGAPSTMPFTYEPLS